MPDIQKKLFGIIQKEVLRFDIDSQGRIKPTVKNLKIKNSISVKLRKLMKDPTWVSAVKDFNKGFKDVAKVQDKWYDSIDKDAI